MENIKQVAAALVKAKRAFGPALKQRENGHLKNKYAGLGECLEAVDAALLENGIALMQETFDDPTGITIETVFLHESGETLRCGKLRVPAVKQDAQGYGSALTYARRYSLMTACGIAPEDDDGNAAVASKPTQAAKTPDIAAILRSISGATTLDILRANHDAAVSMLDEAHHPAVIKASKARKNELTTKKETA